MATPASVTQPLPASDWTHVVGPFDHPIRLSLDGPNSSAFAPRRPIRVTLDSPPLAPAPPVPTLSPPPEPVLPAGSVEAPAAAEAPAVTTVREVHFEERRLRLSLDQAQRGAVGVALIARPIRLQLDGGEPLPAGPRPFRSVLE
jgi:hypothetical protein